MNNESSRSFLLRQNLAKARHDLRNPVSHILGFTEMLLDEKEVAGGGEEKEELERIAEAGNEMLARINQLLDWERFKASDLPPFEAALGRLAEMVVTTSEKLAAQARERQVLSWREDLQRIAGAARQVGELARVVLPLLGTAGGPVNTRAQATGQVGNQGQDLPLETGLAIVSTEAPAILVVDDLEDMRQVLKRRLSSSGYRVYLQENGPGALRFLETNAVDVILLDIGMAGLDGVETLKRLKANPATEQIPVIMLSFADPSDKLARCQELGVVAIMSKPCKELVVQQQIEAALARKRRAD